ncbi:espin-like protein [Trichonephila clavipes]|nr:espin-like protein [Trichonephila clavipes]
MLTAVQLGLGSNPGKGMDDCKCIVPSRHEGTLNSRRAASPLMRLVEGEERWRPRVSSLKIGIPSSPPLCWTHHPHYHPPPAMPDVPLIHRALVAAREGDLQGLQLLRKKQELLQGLHDDFGATCVHYAARGGHVKVLEFLMNKCSMRANVRSFVGATPAHDAAAMGKLPALVWLLRNTDCTLWDRDKDGATVLHIAASILAVSEGISRAKRRILCSALLQRRHCEIRRMENSLCQK